MTNDTQPEDEYIDIVTAKGKESIKCRNRRIDIIPIDVYFDHRLFTTEEQCSGIIKSPMTNEKFCHLQA